MKGLLLGVATLALSSSVLANVKPNRIPTVCEIVPLKNEAVVLYNRPNGKAVYRLAFNDLKEGKGTANITDKINDWYYIDDLPWRNPSPAYEPFPKFSGWIKGDFLGSCQEDQG